jgi:hypothetical protein
MKRERTRTAADETVHQRLLGSATTARPRRARSAVVVPVAGVFVAHNVRVVNGQG